MTTPQPAPQPKRAFRKPFNPIGAIIEYLHILIAITLIGTLITVPVVILKKKPKFGSEGMININPYLPKILYGTEDSNFIRSFEDWMRTQVRIITSYSVLEWAITDYESQGFKWQLPGESMMSAVKRLSGRIQVVQIRDTQLISLTMENMTSHGLADIINCVIKGYIDSSESYTRNQNTYKLDVLNREKQKVQQELDDGYQLLEEISHKSGTAITEEKNLYIYFETLADLRKVFNKLVTDRILAESRMKALETKAEALKRMPFPGLVSERTDTGHGGLIDQINGRIQEAREKMVGLAEDNPTLALLKRRQKEMEDQAARLLEEKQKDQEHIVRGKLLDENQLALENARVEYQTAKDAEKNVKIEIDRAQKEILDYNTATLRVQTRRQENQRLMETLTRINARTDQIQMEFASPGRIEVTAWAQKPEGPNVDPRGKLVPVCFIVSLMAGVGVVIGRDLLDSRIKRPQDMEKLLGFPLTGFLLRGSEENIPHEDLYSLHHRHPRAFMTQQLAEIVIKIDRERLEHNSKVFAFTGLGDGCGVTMLAMNILAMSTVPRNRRLYIDLNNRIPAGSREPLKSIMQTVFGDQILQGFHDSSSDEFPFVFYPSATDVQQGRAHSSEDLKILLDELKTSFDMIVIDLPPILLSADTQAIASIADVAVLTALARHSLWGELMRSITTLDNCGVKVISVILNRVGFIRGGYLRNNLQAFYTLGREKKKRLFDKGKEKKMRWFGMGIELIKRLFRKG